MYNYKFRGKTLDGRWVSGDYYTYQSRHIISKEIVENPTFQDSSGGWVFEQDEIIPNSVGIYIGLKDKNGVDVFVGDILKINLPLSEFLGEPKKEKIGVIVFEPEQGGFIIEWEYSKNQHYINVNCDIINDGEVIGNIIDNPKILKK